MRKNSPLFIIFLIFLAAFTRLIPHYPNFTAVGAIALFGGAFLHKRYLALLVPVAALFVSDLFLNNLVYSNLSGSSESFTLFYAGSLWVYGAFILIVLLGMKLLKSRSIGLLAGTSALASIIFFITTNFGMWIGSGIYPKTIGGLAACYYVALPYFWNTLLGDLFYVGVLFGGYALATQGLEKFYKAISG
jgi:hypothetical protein